MNSLFGKLGKDKITGFEGRIIGHIEYMTGCDQLLLMPPVDKDGKRRDGEWFDQQKIEIIGSDKIVLDNGRTPGADALAPGASRHDTPGNR